MTEYQTVEHVLPDGWSVRPTTHDDAEDLLALVHASDLTAVGFTDFDPADVTEALAGPYSEVAVGPNGEITAWGYLEGGAERDFLEVYVHPGTEDWPGGQPAQRPMLARLIAEVARRGVSEGSAGEHGPAPRTVRAGAIPTETAWIDSVLAAGFDFLKQYARMKIDLPAPALKPSPGVTVRPARDADLPEFFRVLDSAFRDTPDYQPNTYERWRERYVDGHSPRFGEWFVAEVDGETAGILQSSDQSSDNGEGWVKNLAVLAPWRRRGIGRALLAAAFAAYAAGGRTRAGLGVDLANPTEAIRLYTGVGMTPAYQANIYEKTVAAAA